MNCRRFRTESEAETIALGAQLARHWRAPKVVLLIGNLGAGKTTLAKGIAEGLGAAERNEVSSPTFPLIHEYGDPVRVYHVDLYRLDTLAEVATLGLPEIFERDAVVLLEWAERFPQILPEARVEIRIGATAGESRELIVTELPEPLC
ncbi:MAG: tRNA (adenosine(37)-N6)-threonylcarbamoyltransferase complex ATPase subunit type 1 TsaE [Bryobacterales bacterium]|nr:tRNA (adenosine(37)-N6)-threonylcarbamoyltransferase complex ATPase subunit type 1 TsaE [Bryobacterales bacterium]